MSVARFATYFLAVAAFSTIAFASGLAGKVQTVQADEFIGSPLTPMQAEQMYRLSLRAALSRLPKPKPAAAKELHRERTALAD